MNGQVHKWFSNGGSDRKPLTPCQVCLHPIQQDILLLHDPRWDDIIKYTQHSAAGIKQTPQKTHTTHWAPAVMASKTAHYSAT